jgi:hypothetical protein
MGVKTKRPRRKKHSLYKTAKRKSRIKRKHKTKRQIGGKGGVKSTSKTKNVSSSFKQLNCHPSIRTKGKIPVSTSCYDENQLKFIRALWNAKHPDDKISKTESLAKVWNILQTKFKNKCNDEECWVDELKPDTKVAHDLTKSFAPDAPEEWKRKPTMWLSSDEITNVMEQYEDAYTCFDFIGPSPIDFDSRTHGDKDVGVNPNDDCVWEELCKFSVKKCISRGKTKIGVIFNTDPHDKPGQHWISLFINIKKGNIFFFDSVGAKIPDEIMVLVNRIIKQGLKQSPPIHFKFDQNYPVEHQYSDTECGMYSLYFIIQMLEDKLTGEYLKTHIIKDKMMKEHRKILFN